MKGNTRLAFPYLLSGWSRHVIPSVTRRPPGPKLQSPKTVKPCIAARLYSLSGWQDSNLRPPGPKPGALTGLRYTPKNCALCQTDSLVPNQVSRPPDETTPRKIVLYVKRVPWSQTRCLVSSFSDETRLHPENYFFQTNKNLVR